MKGISAFVIVLTTTFCDHNQQKQMYLKFIYFGIVFILQRLEYYLDKNNYLTYKYLR